MAPGWELLFVLILNFPLHVQGIDTLPDNFLLITESSNQTISFMDISNYSYIKIPLRNLVRPFAITYDQIDKVIFWTDVELNQIVSVPIYGNRQRTIRQINSSSGPYGISVDSMSRLLFYTDGGTPIIAALSLDGSKHKVVINSSLVGPFAIVTDPINGTIYWTDGWLNGKIEKSNYDGTNRQELINGLAYPTGLTIDIKVEDEEGGEAISLQQPATDENVFRVGRHCLVPSIATKLFVFELFAYCHTNSVSNQTRDLPYVNESLLKFSNCFSLAGTMMELVDGIWAYEECPDCLKAEVLYWCDPFNHAINRANVDGSNRQLIYQEQEFKFHCVVFYQSYLYYTGWEHRSVMRIRTDGSNRTSVGPSTLGSYFNIHIHGSESLGTNGCSSRQGGCTHFCFPRPGGLKLCACPDGHNLQPDGQTCNEDVTSLPMASAKAIQSDCHPSSWGSTVELTAHRAAVGSFASLLIISVLLNVYFIRKNQKMQMEMTKDVAHPNPIATDDENGGYHTISATVHTEIRNIPDAFCTISTCNPWYNSWGDEQDGYMTPNISGGNAAYGYIQCI